MVEYGQAIITTALATSALPMFLRIDADQGRAAAGEFISTALRMYVLAAIPLVAFMGMAGESVLIFLAGDKYAAGAAIMPWASAGMGVHGAFVLVASGLYLSKRSGTMFMLLFVTAIANVGLSLLLVPILGIEGAAASTLLCYIACAMLAYYFSRQILTISLPWNAGLHGLIAAAAMIYVLSLISHSLPLIDLVFKTVAAMVTYGAAIIMLNREVRATVKQRANAAPLIGKFFHRT